MKSIVEEKENLVSFKTLKQKVFAYACELGRMITQIILENYDDELTKERDTKGYRDKGERETSNLFSKSLSDRTGRRKDCLYLSSGSGDADGKDQADLYKPCRKDCPDSNRSPLSCQCGCDQWYLRPVYQPRRNLESDPAAWGEDQRRRGLCSKVDGSEPGRREKGSRDPL